MKRRVITLFVLVFISALVVISLTRASAQQDTQNITPTQQPRAPARRQAAGPVTPNPTGSVAAQTGAATEAKRTLQCQGCHGAGKTLPYLGGALFHTDEHAAYDGGFHAKAAQAGHKAATCLDCHTRGGDMTTMLPASDPKSTVHRANLAETCGKCHGDPSTMQGTGISDKPFVSYRESVHSQAVARGNTNAAVCTDCHRAHDILPASDSRSPIFKFNVPATCGKCHGDVTDTFMQSVHGQAAARGVSQTPVCTDCHGIHGIKSLAVSETSLRSNTCAQCHEGVRLTQEFDVPGGRVTSYQNSYHGLAKRLGSQVAADCASCHGTHNILPSSDPRSMINQANLQQTCGQCHLGAGEKFAVGRVHLATPVSHDPGRVGVSWVRLIYYFIIIFTVGGMLFHNALSWWRKSAAKLRRQRRTVVRLSPNQRVQHWLLLTSFVVLVVSGFALVYPGLPVEYIGFGTEAVRRMIHRVAAGVMHVVGVYHLAYLAFTKEGRAWVLAMLPGWKDVRDVWQFFGHYLGLGKVPRPKFERFNYGEKVEYWAVVWGTFVMGLTGMMIWFKVGVFGWLPRWWIDIAIAVHFYEAVLATLAIIIWHFYNVYFDPEVYPVNLAFYDGRMSEELYKEEHELDYERMRRDEEAARAAKENEGTASHGGSVGGAEPLAGGAGD